MTSYDYLDLEPDGVTAAGTPLTNPGVSGYLQPYATRCGDPKVDRGIRLSPMPETK
jgi:hypothetical protein